MASQKFISIGSTPFCPLKLGDFASKGLQIQHCTWAVDENPLRWHLNLKPQMFYMIQCPGVQSQHIQTVHATLHLTS